MEAFKRAMEVYLTQQSSPSILRVHEIQFVNANRSGDGIPLWASYIDENYFVRVVAPGDIWAKQKIISVQVGKGSAE